MALRSFAPAMSPRSPATEMRVIPYPETCQVFSFDCGANALVSILVFAGVEDREDRIIHMD